MLKRSNVLMISVATALLIVVIGLVLNNSIIATNADAIDLKYVTSQGKIKGYSDFNALNNDTDIIVKGTKNGVKQTILERKDEVLTDYRTISNVEIKKVFKGPFKNGDTIIVQENAAAEGNTVYSTEGYQLMNENEEYLLFLRESATEPNVYIIKGVVFGKVPTAEFNASEEFTFEDLQYKGDSKKVKEMLKAIYREALKTYK